MAIVFKMGKKIAMLIYFNKNICNLARLRHYIAAVSSIYKGKIIGV